MHGEHNIQYPEEKGVYIKEYNPQWPTVDICCSKHADLEAAKDELQEVISKIKASYENYVYAGYFEKHGKTFKHIEGKDQMIKEEHQFEALIEFSNKSEQELQKIVLELRKLLDFHNEPKRW